MFFYSNYANRPDLLLLDGKKYIFSKNTSKARFNSDLIVHRAYKHVGLESHHLAGKLFADMDRHSTHRIARPQLFEFRGARNTASPHAEDHQLSRQLRELSQDQNREPQKSAA